MQIDPQNCKMDCSELEKRNIGLRSPFKETIKNILNEYL